MTDFAVPEMGPFRGQTPPEGPSERSAGRAPLEPPALEPLCSSEPGTTSPWLRLWALMVIERRELLSLVVYAIVLGGLSLAVPIAAQVLVNTIAFGSLLQPLVVLATLLCGVLVFSGLVQVIEWYVVEVFQRRIFVRVSEDFARRLPAVQYAVHGREDARELTNRFFEVVGLQKTSSRLLLDGLGLALQTLVGMALLAFYHPVLLAFDVALVVALVVVVALGWGAVPSAIDESRAKYRVAAWLETVADAPTVFKRDPAARFAAARADALTRDYLDARKRHYGRVLRQLIGGVGLQVLAMVMLLGLGGWLVMEGELTLGQLVAAELVVGIVGAGFAKIGKHLEAGYDLLASLDKVGKVLDLPVDEAAAGHEHDEPIGELVLGGVRARENGPTVNATLTAGSRVSLEAAPGGGKSALLEVLAGLRPVSGGTLSSGDMVVRPSRLRARACLLASGHVLEGGSILDNLRVADPHMDEPTAWSLLRKVGLAPRVSRLEGGVHTRLFREGTPLSSSERARLALARALGTRPDLLLIDGLLDLLSLEEGEDDPALDAVFAEGAPWTVVVVGRDPNVRARCEQRIVLEGAGR